ncbi:MAG TPA: hypothetical protein VNG12_05295 [Acidimicrobiales bacterium]|nr:hypothetical protein [Acidimicrobiales bacterium]
MTRYDTYRAGQQTVTTRFPPLEASLRFLESQQDAHFDVVGRLCGAPSGHDTVPLFEIDVVLLSVLNRSLDLVDGFRATFDRWNLTSAAPQVRMQVDNLLRLNLVLLAPPNTVAKLLLSGERMSRHVDPLAPPGSKVKLTDHRLREHARPYFPWLDRVYENASAWVHFSGTHVGVTMNLEDEGASVFGRFPSDIGVYPYDFLEQVLWAMNETTAGILQIANDFAIGKEQARRK